MVFENIEHLKQQYTDKYVVVDETRPELRRFQGQTGVVKTVNMSGRALVEFGTHQNIGWYDIELDFLKVLDKPLPEPEPVKKAPSKAASPAAAKKPAGGKGMSVEEMLAAARGEKSSAKSSPTPKAESKAASAAPAKPAAKAKPQQMSVEEMLAAARAEKSGGSTADTEEKQAPAAAAPPVEPEAPAKTARNELPADTADIVAFCRKVDG